MILYGFLIQNQKVIGQDDRLKNATFSTYIDDKIYLLNGAMLHIVQIQPNMPQSSMASALGRQPSTEDMLRLQQGIMPAQNDQTWQLEDTRRKKQASMMDPLAQSIVANGRKVDIENYLGLLRQQSPLSSPHLMTLANLRHMADNPEFAASVAEMNITGICGSGIIEVVAEMFLAGIISEDGIVDGALAERSSRVRSHGRTWSYVLHFAEDETQRDIVVTQNDVRQIQLAKAALYAGIKLLMDKMGVSAVDRIRLAGAFGSHISVEHAMVLGLIPDCALDHVSSAGNAAGVGARIALLDHKARGAIQQTVNCAERIETATESDFQDYFVAAMAFPHKTDTYPHLFSVVEPPLKKVVEQTDGRRRRRRS
mgnify:CR=1 FL=1